MRCIATVVEIDAPAIAIWRVLADFAAYPEWNPFIRRLEGEPVAGARIRVTVEPPGRKPMAFHAIVRAAEPGRELRWLGRVLIPRIFDGEHAFIIDIGGKMRDLNNDIGAESALYTLTNGQAINNKGEIVVDGIVNGTGEPAAFLLEPRRH